MLIQQDLYSCFLAFFFLFILRKQLCVSVLIALQNCSTVHVCPFEGKRKSLISEYAPFPLGTGNRSAVSAEPAQVCQSTRFQRGPEVAKLLCPFFSTCQNNVRLLMGPSIVKAKN